MSVISREKGNNPLKMMINAFELKQFMFILIPEKSCFCLFLCQVQLILYNLLLLNVHNV